MWPAPPASTYCSCMIPASSPSPWLQDLHAMRRLPSLSSRMYSSAALMLDRIASRTWLGSNVRGPPAVSLQAPGGGARSSHAGLGLGCRVQRSECGHARTHHQKLAGHPCTPSKAGGPPMQVLTHTPDIRGASTDANVHLVIMHGMPSLTVPPGCTQSALPWDQRVRRAPCLHGMPGPVACA